MYDTARENLKVINEKSGALDGPHVILAVMRHVHAFTPTVEIVMRRGKDLDIELDITTRGSSSLDVGTGFAALAISSCPASRPRFGFEALVPRACAYVNAAW